LQLARSQSKSYYAKEGHDTGGVLSEGKNILYDVLSVIGVIAVLILGYFLFKYLRSRKIVPMYKPLISKRKVSKTRKISGRAGSYLFDK
jgi:hypothetical protein